MGSSNNFNLWFVTGFSDGESTFTFNITKSLRNSVRYKIQLLFRLGLHSRDLALLEKIPQIFEGKGHISYNNKNNSAKFTL